MVATPSFGMFSPILIAMTLLPVSPLLKAALVIYLRY
jgi:hypothetical protein